MRRARFACRGRSSRRDRGRRRDRPHGRRRARPTWTYHVWFGERTLTGRAGRRAVPNRSQPRPSGSERSGISELALDDERRDVVRDDVDERDRQQRPDEVRDERPRRVHGRARQGARARRTRARRAAPPTSSPPTARERHEQLADARLVDEVRRLRCRPSRSCHVGASGCTRRRGPTPSITATKATRPRAPGRRRRAR